MSMGIANSQGHGMDEERAVPKPRLHEALESVQAKIAAVWPLKDYIAVNPYQGLTGKPFWDARGTLQRISECETLMPISYYRKRFQDGHFGLDEVRDAIDEAVADQTPGAEILCAKEIHDLLVSDEDSFTTDTFQQPMAPKVRPISQHYDRYSATSWSETIAEEVSKFCAAHYDEGQATWSNPWKGLPLFQAWRSSAKHDRRIEILGLSGFRTFVDKLPHTPKAAIAQLLGKARVPEDCWDAYLTSLTMSLPGWSAWAKYNASESVKQGEDSEDLVGLLAIRLAYDVALSERFDFRVSVQSSSTSVLDSAEELTANDTLLRFTLLRANEVGIRNRIVSSLAIGDQQGNSSPYADVAADRKLAQIVFCIDVRSERIRRHLEAVSNKIETFGFAGFFGLPFEYVRLGETSGTNQLPVLVEPQFRVYEEVRSEQSGANKLAKGKRKQIRNLRKVWKRFQSSAVGCFAFVETTGLLFSGTLLRKTFGLPAAHAPRFDGVMPADRSRLGPGFRDLHRQGVSTTQQADMAESILRSLGVTENFARLVVFCGHASQTENNPLQAGLDCGACAGHSGEPNARFAAMLLNQPYVRQTLVKRGIQIPTDTHFLAGLHNTTTDDLEFFDVDLVPESHLEDVQELKADAAIAGQSTRNERLATLPGKNESTLIRRSTDWSEVRPEWGLTGNAAFIVGPRRLTQSMNLNGESFLHSYDHRNDPEGTLLAQIMTAPMVVAHWINMQYYASTVDQRHFGSDTKTVHNVVGKFGILSGNSGDLKTGLPWQSIHDGEEYRHDPVRLLSVIEAPLESIDRVLAKHDNVRDLIVNGWVQLVAVDGGECYRYSASGNWDQLESAPSQVDRKVRTRTYARQVS